MRKQNDVCAVIVELIVFVVLVSGCRTPSGIDVQKPFQPMTNQGGEIVAPPEEDAARLRPGLIINVNVLVAGKKEIEASGKRITDKGTISMPLLGVVRVNDMTLDELGHSLTESYKEYLVKPQVIVEFVRDDNKEGLSPWGNVTVLGRVKKPGRVSLPATRDLTLSGAIQQAGGYDTSAKENAIRITRRRSGGGIKTWQVDLRSVGAEGLIENDVLLEPDDVVFIPELIF